jgi:hypothetical protein
MNRIIRKSVLFAVTGSFLFVISACDLPKKMAKGKEDEIIVIADSLEYQQIEPLLEKTFGQVIYTPQPENLFILKRKDYSELNNYKNQKNILIVAPLNSGTSVSQYIDNVLNPDVKQKVLSDSNFVFNKYNLWASSQLVMVLTSADMEKLKKNITENSDDLLYYFQKLSNQRLYKSLYNAKYEKKNIEAKLLKDYGWIIYVQADFELAVSDSAENFVWLRRAPDTDMERWIFVHWIDNGSPELLNQDSILAIRNRVTEKYYRTIDERSYVQAYGEEFIKATETNFLGKYAIMTQGLWRMTDAGMGGPFVNYTFYDEKTRRIYMLDGSVFAPKYHKKGLIQQVDVTLQSFKTREELSQDKIEELMDELE